MSLTFACVKCDTPIDPKERGQGNRKYCVPCGKQVRNIDRHKRVVFSPIGEKIIYLLKTNKQASKGELCAFSGAAWPTVRTIVYQLRKSGHKIKFGMGGYHYGGFKE